MSININFTQIMHYFQDQRTLPLFLLSKVPFSEAVTSKTVDSLTKFITSFIKTYLQSVIFVYKRDI